MKRKIIFSILVIMSLLMLINMMSCEDEEQGDNTPHTHSYGEWETIKNPTCTEDGEKAKKCSCADTVTEKIPALAGETLPKPYKFIRSEQKWL